MLLRIAYDLRILTERMHGIARYGLGLLRGILSQAKQQSFNLVITVLLRRNKDVNLLPSDSRLNILVCDIKPYSLKSQYKLPRILRHLNPNLYHFPSYAPPIGWNGPIFMTIHDLIHLRFPKDYDLKHRLFYQIIINQAIRKAHIIFTVSHFSRQDLIKFLNVPPFKIEVTPCGVDQIFQYFPQKNQSHLDRLGLPPRYILAVGNPRPHKNLLALIKAHHYLNKKNIYTKEDVPPLVLIGAKKNDLGKELINKNLLLCSNLNDIDLALAYNAAEMVVIPSLYEGFGLPALEALACGTPVIAANRASLPELVGKAGLLCEPNPNSLAQAIAQVLVDQNLRERMRTRGINQAARFTWEQAGMIALKNYRKILKNIK